MLTILYPSLATISFAALWVGFTLRAQNKYRHAALMGLGMGLDLALVLTLEFTRNAIGTVLVGNLTVPQMIHVAASTAAVVLYVPVFLIGWRRLFHPSPGNLRLRDWHRRLGYTALAFRSVGFAFMFTMLSHPA